MWSLRVLTVMIPSLQIVQMIYMLWLHQTMQIFCGINTKIQQLGWKEDHIFGYNFNTPLEKGNVLIWKISGNHEPFTPLQYFGQTVQFGSKETYLVLTQKPKIAFTIYYWLGRNSSLIDIKTAATYAIFLANTYLPQRWINIAREIEGMESDSFQHTMKMFHKHGEPRQENDDYALYVDIQLHSPPPNLYAVHGKRYSRVKKIPLSLGVQWLKGKDTCLVSETGYKVKDMMPVNVYCSVETNENHIKRSKTFAVDFFGYMTTSDGHYAQEFEDISYTHEVSNNKRSNDFKQFLEMLEDNRFYNPNDVDDSGDHLKNADEFVIERDKEITFFNVSNDGLRINSTRPLHFGIFQQCDSVGYVLDTKSIAGVFLILTVTKKMQDKVKAIKLAEEYMEEKYPLSAGKIVRMRIEMTVLYTHFIDCRINLSDYPAPLMSTLPDYEVRQ